MESVVERKDAEIRDLKRRLKEVGFNILLSRKSFLLNTILIFQVETERDTIKNEIKNMKEDLVIKQFTSSKNPSLAPKENNQQKEVFIHILK